MLDPAEIQTYAIGGIRVAAISVDGFDKAVRDWLQARQPGVSGAYVCFRDAHGIVRAQDDPAILSAHREAWLVVPDGRPVMWIGKLRGFANVEQISGIEAVDRLCAAGLPHGWRHFFIGGQPGTAEQLADVLKSRHFGLQVAGTECPPFRQLTEVEQQEQLDRIRAAKPDLLWVGLGSPKQDLWMAHNAGKLSGVMAFGVGAAFDVYTGHVPRAPKWLQKTGLEWAYRLAKEPIRLWPRYSRVVPRYLALVLREQISQSLSRSPGN